MSLTLYGIPNCDTIKKARAWLADQGLAYAFHDYRKQGVPKARLEAWVSRLGWETLLNRSGTTFRGLPEADKAGLDTAKALTLMAAHPAMIRRPVLESGDQLLVGFKPAEWQRALG